MIRVVYDTNVILSGFLWRGNEWQCMMKVEEGEVILFLNKEIISEIYEVARREKLARLIKKAKFTPEELLRKITSMGEIVDITKKIDLLIEDIEDKKFIECAIAAQAHYIVSGDSHLLKLKRFEEIEIIGAKEFLSRIKK